MRKGDWKLLVNRRESTGLELFDLANDPVESTNLVVEHPDIAQDLQGSFISWMNEMAMRNGEEVPNWRMGEMFDKAEQNYNITVTSDEGLTSLNRSGANERDKNPVGMTIDDTNGMIDGLESSTSSGSASWVPGLRCMVGCILLFHQLI